VTEPAATMGVPFEALIPFGIMLAVRLFLGLVLNGTRWLTVCADVRGYRSGNVEDQTHAERRQEGEAFGGSMGQSELIAADFKGREMNKD
jgi:hypothetical protein